ncbi:MAG: hypothetical protein JNM39_14330 [Bdellovibrionaceae bacterium]|nr:hypothetical protein [Pseudobdellovibrionaceae bacterium]
MQSKKEYPRKAELPFDSNIKMVATLHEINGEQIVYIKGAAEPLLKLCGSIDTNTGYPVASVSEAMISELPTTDQMMLRSLIFKNQEAEEPDEEVSVAMVNLDFLDQTQNGITSQK